MDIFSAWGTHGRLPIEIFSQDNVTQVDNLEDALTAFEKSRYDLYILGRTQYINPSASAKARELGIEREATRIKIVAGDETARTKYRQLNLQISLLCNNRPDLALFPLFNGPTIYLGPNESEDPENRDKTIYLITPFSNKSLIDNIRQLVPEWNPPEQFRNLSC